MTTKTTKAITFGKLSQAAAAEAMKDAAAESAGDVFAAFERK